MARALRVAIEGCGHGTLNAIYDSIRKTCEINKWPGVDLLIIGGDFQAVRNMQDLNVMSCPPKYRKIGDFHEYYSGARQAPYLTVFVGGNHEASSHLWELYYGGWAAPNIYYLGASSILNFRGLRIGGLSGIYNAGDYNRLHGERLPYSYSDVKSVYHVRAYDVFKLHQSSEPMDVMISHDWPQGIEFSGDLDRLLKMKPFFKHDIEQGELGSPPSRSLLYKLKPRYWFSAHLHVKFRAVVDHEEGKEPKLLPRKQVEAEPEAGPQAKNPDELDIALDMDESDGSVVVSIKNSDEIELDMGEEPVSFAEAPANSDEIELDMDEPEIVTAALAKNSDEIELDLDEEPKNVNPNPISPSAEIQQPNFATTPGLGNENRYTNFLALDKCLPRRDFLEILEISLSATTTTAPTISNKSGLSYDPEWLAITRALNPYLHSPPTHSHTAFRNAVKQAEIAAEITKQREWVEENIVKQGKLAVPDNFVVTAPVHAVLPKEKWGEGPDEWPSPQTATFCEMLGIENGTFEGEVEKAARREKKERKEGGSGGEGGGWRGKGKSDGGRWKGGGRGRGGGYGGRRGGRGGEASGSWAGNG